MAARIPIKISSANLKEMSTDDKAAIISRAKWLYLNSQSVTISQVGSSGTMDAMSDTRTQAGGATSHASSFRSAGDTPNVSTVTVAYDKISSATAGSLTFNDNGSTTRMPVYKDSNHNIRAMTPQEMFDTYADTLIDAIIATQPYKIHTSTSLSGYANVSSTAVFTDTRANAGAYSAGGITETQDQPTTITNYFLMRNNGSETDYSALPMYINGDNNLREYTEAQFDAIILEMIRYVAVNLNSHKIRYYIGGSGTTLGSSMVNTKLNGSTYAQREVGGDDYRTQEFPAGSAATISTYLLKARKE
jgi:hypothetical protein